MEEKLRCSVCGVNLAEENSFEFNGEVLCQNCLYEKSVICDCCGTRISRENADGDEYTTLCGSCYNNRYTNCENCGVLIHNDNAYCIDDDDDYYYCSDCYEKLKNRPIKSYSYKPETKFYGEGNLFYGIELEIDKGGEYDENAQKIIDIANYDGEKIYCKHHGSHNTSTCGLHIHASREVFGDTYEKQEEVIARIVHFVELHWNEILKFTRRTEENINRWAVRYGISTRAYDTYKNAKDKHMGRYVAVNLENSNTIEFRLFRGTLLYSTFAATLQLVDEICKDAIALTDKEIESMSWSDFVINISKEKKELIDYLKIKRLYVNEINTESEKI